MKLEDSNKPTVSYKVILPDTAFWQGMIPCQKACPVLTDAGRYVQLISAGSFLDGYLSARSPNPFVSVCGRVCAAPCEDKCRRGKIDSPITIRALKRFLTERYGVESINPDTQDILIEGGAEPGNKYTWHLPQQVQSRKSVARGNRVAVIGGGPAGLSCAHDLSIMGYEVTIFEATDRLGGMMVHGIPEFRLPRSIIEKEIDRILSFGVRVEYRTPLTSTFGISELRKEGFEAIFLAIGTQRGRDLQVPGAELDGIIKAIDYIINVNRGYRIELGQKVVVIGGGFVAFDAARIALRAPLAETFNGESATPIAPVLDAARMAIRAGARQVSIVSLESFDEMPVLRTSQGKEEFEEAEREGVNFITQRGVESFVGKDGRVSRINLIGVTRTYDPDGRFNPQYDRSISEVMEADTVILAIGQQADLSFLKEEDGIFLTRAGTIQVDAETLATTAPGIYAGGDVAFGPRNLIDAVANGKRAAISIDNYIRNIKYAPAVKFFFEKLPKETYTMPEGYERVPRFPPPTKDLGRRTGISEVEEVYDEADARRQADRCLRCHIQTIFNAELCIMCNRCVDVCPENCLKLIPLTELSLSNVEVADVLTHYGYSADLPLSAMIKDDEKCIRCGLCAIRCPTEAMTMEVMYYEEKERVAV